MLMKHRKWLALLPLCALASCQTTSSGSSTDAAELLTEAVASVRAEMCRGQSPNPVNVTPEEFDTWPDQARAYVVGNVRQYQAQCP